MEVKLFLKVALVLGLNDAVVLGFSSYYDLYENVHGVSDICYSLWVMCNFFIDWIAL